MALLGNAALLLWFDVVPERVAEHDDWHTREHFPERVAIPGFLRAQRWVSSGPGSRYFVMYEVTDVDVLTSPAYLERLNNPTPWTRTMMPHYRGMVRGFCTPESRHGTVLGTSGLVIRCAAAPGMEDQLQQWLDRDLLPELTGRTGIASAFLFRSARPPEMTAEQRIRGRDAGVALALLVTAYVPDVVAELAADELSAKSLAAHGASPDVASGTFQLACLSGAR